MCGIVGYIGDEETCPILLDGLERLSYRGYDSAGVAVLNKSGKLDIAKTRGRLENLGNLLEVSPLFGHIGIGHTRWATHGEPNDVNAHPHFNTDKSIAIVHNGIIENHAQLRKQLIEQGCVFVSQTDTEVVAHLLSTLYEGSMKDALLKAGKLIKGSYALGVVCEQEPSKLFCTRNESPLVVGHTDGRSYIASDIPAMLSHTRDVIFLEDREVAVLSPDGIEVVKRSRQYSGPRAVPCNLGPEQRRKERLSALHAQGNSRATDRAAKHILPAQRRRSARPQLAAD